ncbi:WbqC family protein [Paenibacillus sp. FSL W8-0186]|uniref:WbqC family protein n=1 Tax=Paenibacillus sp. FSL W8-0186 TaxID=2921709 RepID=UPI0030D61CD4
MSRVAVLQSNYIPWKGYFDIIQDVDQFIFYDDVQYTKNDWRNRNKVKTSSGSQWLTIPVNAASDMLICDVVLPNNNWAVKHFKTLEALYSKAPYFKNFKPFLEYVYLERKWVHLSELNQYLIKYISKNYLGISTGFLNSREIKSEGKKLDRLLSILKEVNAKTYISGPAAREYIIEDRFENEGIRLVYKDYNNYPKYAQFHPPFDDYVTIFDLLFHTGSDAPYYIWGWRNNENACEF